MFFHEIILHELNSKNLPWCNKKHDAFIKIALLLTVYHFGVQIPFKGDRIKIIDPTIGLLWSECLRDAKSIRLINGCWGLGNSLTRWNSVIVLIRRSCLVAYGKLCFLSRKVSCLVDVCDEPGLNGVPSQLFPGLPGRRRNVERSEVCKPAKMNSCLFGGFADHRNAQPSSDDFGYIPERNAFFCHPVKPGSCSRSLLQCKPVQAGSIEPVHRGPAVESLATIY